MAVSPYWTLIISGSSISYSVSIFASTTFLPVDEKMKLTFYPFLLWIDVMFVAK